MPQECERDHSEMRRDVSEQRIQLVGLSKDLEIVKNLISAMTIVLQDNLVTISAHDKNSTDWRGQFMSTADSVMNHIEAIERAIQQGNGYHEDFDDIMDRLKKSFDAQEKNGKLLRAVLGLENYPNPLPINRDIKEILEHVRDSVDLDSLGKPKVGMALWGPRITKSFTHGIAIAIVALVFNLLLPYLPWSRAAAAPAPSAPLSAPQH